jgi:hypothetical protein
VKAESGERRVTWPAPARWGGADPGVLRRAASVGGIRLGPAPQRRISVMTDRSGSRRISVVIDRARERGGGRERTLAAWLQGPPKAKELQ